jgi:hypothetical protein
VRPSGIAVGHKAGTHRGIADLPPSRSGIRQLLDPEHLRNAELSH